jgi:hypothetical protein
VGAAFVVPAEISATPPADGAGNGVKLAAGKGLGMDVPGSVFCIINSPPLSIA